VEIPPNLLSMDRIGEPGNWARKLKMKTLHSKVAPAPTREVSNTGKVHGPAGLALI